MKTGTILIFFFALALLFGCGARDPEPAEPDRPSDIAPEKEEEPAEWWAGEGGLEMLYRMTPEQISGEQETKIRDVVGGRLRAAGVDRMQIAFLPGGRVAVRVPKAGWIARQILQSLVETPGRFRFRVGAPDDLARVHRGHPAPEGYEWLEYKDDAERAELVVIDDGYDLGGGIIGKAQFACDAVGNPAVSFTIKPDFQKAFGDLTESLSSDALGPDGARKLAIVLDGKILSAPAVRARIEANGLVTLGQNPSKEEAERLAAVLNGGELPVRLRHIESKEAAPERR